LLNSVLLFNFEKNVWTDVRVGGNTPKPLKKMQIVCLPKRRVFLWGGILFFVLFLLFYYLFSFFILGVTFEGQYQSRAFMLDLDSGVWSEIKTIESVPSPRISFGMHMLPTNKIIMFGGQGPTGWLGDSWLFHLGKLFDIRNTKQTYNFIAYPKKKKKNILLL
jgi:hypothetical protein